jgi:hypothetical protein
MAKKGQTSAPKNDRTDLPGDGRVYYFIFTITAVSKKNGTAFPRLNIEKGRSFIYSFFIVYLTGVCANPHGWLSFFKPLYSPIVPTLETGQGHIFMRSCFPLRMGIQFFDPSYRLFP